MKQMKKVIFWFGRIIVTIVALYFLTVILLSIVFPSDEPMSLESWGIFIMTGLVVAGTVFSFFRDRIGALILLGVGILFGIFALLTAGQNHFGAFMVSGGPIVIGSLLMLLSFKMK
jgi:lipoprotein signal peptidase